MTVQKYQSHLMQAYELALLDILLNPDPYPIMQSTLRVDTVPGKAYRHIPSLHVNTYLAR